MEEKELFKKAIEDIDELTMLFYQQKNQEGYAKLDDTLTSISNAVDFIGRYPNQVSYPMEHINEILNAAMASLEKKDVILLSDILLYELKTYLEKTMEAM